VTFPILCPSIILPQIILTTYKSPRHFLSCFVIFPCGTIPFYIGKLKSPSVQLLSDRFFTLPGTCIHNRNRFVLDDFTHVSFKPINSTISTNPMNPGNPINILLSWNLRLCYNSFQCQHLEKPTNAMSEDLRPES